MIGDHIAQRAAGFVIAAAPPDTNRFRDHDLNVIDVAIIPDRFPDRVGETHRQNVLHRFFAQIMVDAKHVGFIEVFAEHFIQLVRRAQIATERFFDDDATKAARFLFAEIFDNRPELFRRRREIVNAIAFGRHLLVEVGEARFQFRETFGFIVGAFLVENALRQPRPGFVGIRQTRELLHAAFEFFAQFVFGFFAAPVADDGERIRQRFLRRQIVKRGHEFAAR